MQEILKCILVMRDVLCQHHEIHNCSNEVYCSRCIMCKKWCNHQHNLTYIVFWFALIHCFMLLYLWKIFNSAKTKIEQNWWSSCVTSDALEISCLMSFFFLAAVMLFSISCFNQWTKYVTVPLSSWCSTSIIIVA